MAAHETPLNGQISELRAEIGEPLSQEPIDANMEDICLHHAGSTRLAVRSLPPDGGRVVLQDIVSLRDMRLSDLERRLAIHD